MLVLLMRGNLSKETLKIDGDICVDKVLGSAILFKKRYRKIKFFR